MNCYMQINASGKDQSEIWSENILDKENYNKQTGTTLNIQQGCT